MIIILKWLNSSIWFIDGILTGTTTPRQSGSGSNSNQGVFYILKSSKTWASSSDGVQCHTQDTGWDTCLTPLQKCSQCVLQFLGFFFFSLFFFSFHFYRQRKKNKNNNDNSKTTKMCIPPRPSVLHLSWVVHPASKWVGRPNTPRFKQTTLEFVNVVIPTPNEMRRTTWRCGRLMVSISFYR